MQGIEGAALCRVRSARAEVLAERRQFRARAHRRPHRRGDRRRARARRLPSQSIVRARLRGLPADRRRATSTTRSAALERHRGGPVRRAVIDRRTTETSIAMKIELDGKGTYQRPDRHPFPRSHAGAVRASRRLRPDDRRERRPRRRSAPHRRGSRHRARRGRLGCARHAARHQPRRLLRDADGRNAGGRGHRSRRAAARRRRSEGESRRASATCRPSSCTTSSKASRSARAPTCTSRCSTAARAIITSRRSSRRSRERCASPARKTSGWREVLPSTKGLL